jgi:hypothetical protein
MGRKSEFIGKRGLCPLTPPPGRRPGPVLQARNTQRWPVLCYRFTFCFISQTLAHTPVEPLYQIKCEFHHKTHLYCCQRNKKKRRRQCLSCAQKATFSCQKKRPNCVILNFQTGKFAHSGLKSSLSPTN